MYPKIRGIMQSFTVKNAKNSENDFFYLIDNNNTPWGDWGDVIFYGLLEDIDGDFYIERVAQSTKDIYILNNYLIVNSVVKKLLLENNLINEESFIKTKIKKLVNIDISEWDHCNDISDYIAVEMLCEPEDIIIKAINDENLYKDYPDFYVVDIQNSIILEKTPSFSINRKELIKDTHIYETINYIGILVSEDFRMIIQRHYPNLLKFSLVGWVN